MWLGLLLKYWQTGVAIVLLGVAVGYCRARDSANVERGRAQERYRVADSSLKVIEKKLMAVDTLIVRDTIRVRKTVEKVVTLRDTVLKRLTDTVLVKEFIRVADSTVRACTDLSRDCAEFRRFALQKFQQDSVKLNAIRPIVAKSCVLPVGMSVVLGGVGGWFVTRAGFFK